MAYDFRNLARDITRAGQSRGPVVTTHIGALRVATFLHLVVGTPVTAGWNADPIGARSHY